MTAAERIELVSVEDYLASELTSEFKHEYLGGYVYAMSGGTNTHHRVATDLLGILLRGLDKGPCEAFFSDVLLSVHSAGAPRFYYPDAMVVCESTPPSATYQDKPVVLVEVLSESTRRIDLGEKRDAYLTIPSLETLLLVETEKPEIVVQQRTPDGFDASIYRGLEASVPLPAIGIEIPLAEVFRRVEFADVPSA